MLSSVITLPKSDTGVIQIIHPSFPDFLVDSSRCTRTDLLVQPREHHPVLAKRCLKIMSSFLGSGTSNISDSNRGDSILLEPTRVRPPPRVQYALRHWAHHLLEGKMDEEAFALVNAFSQKHLLRWLEALILMDEAEVIVDVLQMAERALNVCRFPPLR